MRLVHIHTIVYSSLRPIGRSLEKSIHVILIIDVFKLSLATYIRDG